MVIPQLMSNSMYYHFHFQNWTVQFVRVNTSFFITNALMNLIKKATSSLLVQILLDATQSLM